MYMHIYMLILVIHLLLHTIFFFTIYRQREEDWVWYTLDTDTLR